MAALRRGGGGDRRGGAAGHRGGLPTSLLGPSAAVALRIAAGTFEDFLLLGRPHGVVDLGPSAARAVLAPEIAATNFAAAMPAWANGSFPRAVRRPSALHAPPWDVGRWLGGRLGTAPNPAASDNVTAAAAHAAGDAVVFWSRGLFAPPAHAPPRPDAPPGGDGAGHDNDHGDAGAVATDADEFDRQSLAKALDALVEDYDAGNALFDATPRHAAADALALPIRLPPAPLRHGATRGATRHDAAAGPVGAWLRRAVLDRRRPVIDGGIFVTAFAQRGDWPGNQSVPSSPAAPAATGGSLPWRFRTVAWRGDAPPGVMPADAAKITAPVAFGPLVTAGRNTALPTAAGDHRARDAAAPRRHWLLRFDGTWHDDAASEVPSPAAARDTGRLAYLRRCREAVWVSARDAFNALARLPDAGAGPAPH